MTFRELLDDMDADEDDLLDAIESWAYGGERVCPDEECRDGDLPVWDDDREPRWIPCPTCHGTGKVREPGLVERCSETNDPNLTAGEVLAALRQELGGEA